MSIIINNNPASISAQRNLSVSSDSLSRSVERLSSGLRITRAADDAAGLGLSETLRAHIRSINQAVRNSSDGISLTQVADGGASTIGNLLSRLRELASQSASGTVGSTERSYIDSEFLALRSEIDRIAQVTEFNGQALSSGPFINFSVQVGFKSGSGNTLSLNLNDLTIVARDQQCQRVHVGQCTERIKQYRQGHQRCGYRRCRIWIAPEPVRGDDRESPGFERKPHGGRIANPRCGQSHMKPHNSPRTRFWCRQVSPCLHRRIRCRNRHGVTPRVVDYPGRARIF